MKVLASLPMFAAAALLAIGCTAVSDDATLAAELGETTQALGGVVTSAQIVNLSPTAKVLRLFDASGIVVATYYPGFFRAIQQMPDILNDPSNQIDQNNVGTRFLATAINPNNGTVAVAVRAVFFAEVSFDMVFRMNTRAVGFSANPTAPNVAQLLPFDGRTASGYLATSGVPTKPFIDISSGAGSLSYSSLGRLTVRTSGASDTSGTIVYNPNGRPFSCVFVGEASARCPAGF